MKKMRLYFIFLTLSYIHSSHANPFGEITVIHPYHGSQTLMYEKINGFATVEGDILLGKHNPASFKASILLPTLTSDWWPNGIIPFEFASNLPYPNKLAVLQAIAHYKEHTNVRFVERTAQNRSEYPDYIQFIPISGSMCASFVGRQKGPQVIMLAPRCNTMNTVHEIGHALGLWHEQSRHDRDAYVRIQWENIEEEHRFNFDQHFCNGEDFGEYDYQSIMHYPAYAFSKNGKKTIEPLIEGVEIGQRDRLSEKDIAAINAMYPLKTSS